MKRSEIYSLNQTASLLKISAWLQRNRTIPLWCAAIVSLIGILVLIGWTFEIDFLKRIVPEYVFMSPVSAASFILSSLALWVLHSSNVRRMRIARVCALIVFLVGIIKFCAIVSLFDAGIDRRLFSDRLFNGITGRANQMSLTTAFNFLLFGAALMLLSLKAKRRDFFSEQYLAILVLLISFLTIIGYLYGAKSFYIIVSFSPMAIHSAVSFSLLAVGLLLSKPAHGLVRYIFSQTTADR